MSPAMPIDEETPLLSHDESALSAPANTKARALGCALLATAVFATATRARFTASVWSWEDGTDWDAYDHSNTDGMINTGETKLAITTDGKWHDWGTGASSLHVVCRLEDVVPTPAPTATS